MNIKLSPYLSILVTLLISNPAFSEEIDYENNLDVYRKSSELKSIEADKKLKQSLFYPELNLKTGLGSEYTRDKSETDKGRVLYLDAKINLYNGMQDSKELNILEKNLSKVNLEQQLEKTKLDIKVYKILSEINFLKEEIKVLENELKENATQELMAKKKVDAGLTSSAELLDFQIKEANLKNEIKVNDIKTKENETEILNSLGNTYSLDEIQKKFQFNEQTLSNSISPEANINLQVLKNDFETSNIELSKSKSSYNPKLDLEAKAGKITPISTLLKDKTEHQVALTLTIPLFSGFSSSAEVQKAATQNILAERALRNFQNNFSKNIEITQKKIELNNSLKDTFEVTLKKAEKFKDQTIFEYKKGIKNSPDLISASDRTLELKRRILEIKKDINISTYEFNKNISN